MSDTEKIWTFDQLLRQRATDEDQTPLLAFPREKKGIADYETITGACLNQFVDGAAKCLIRRGFPEVVEELVIGICAPTDLDYLVNIFALMRLGYTVFQLSHRLAPTAISELLISVLHSRQTLLYNPLNNSIKLDSLGNLELISIVTREDYDNSLHTKTPPIAPREIDLEGEHHRRCLILHSSGSTGLPKPIDYNHQKLMAAGVYAQDATAFITMPFSHALSMMSYMQAIHRRKTIYAMNGWVPQTHDTVTAAVMSANPDIIWTVPYVLKLLAEKPDGIDALKNCRFVSSGGSKLHDELGDLLTSAGVHIGMQFGSTETGLILSSAYRPREDKAWNYLRPPAHVAPYLLFQPVDSERYECIVLDGHKGKTISNSDDPPKSWRTNDLFIPHATLRNAWKFVGRMDDRITLLNGEKVLPLSMEAMIRSHRLVREAVIFGINREVPGLLLFRALDTGGLGDQEYLDQVWPVIAQANKHAEAFSQITKEMVAIIPENVECPLTDKNSIKRGLIYKEFASIIDGIYAATEKVNKVQSLQLNIAELEDWILDTTKSQGHQIVDVHSDFFAAGMDSLQAIHLRGKILNNIDLGGHESECTSMIVFDSGNTKRLARRLYTIRTNGGFSDESGWATSTIRALSEKYSNFETSENHRSLTQLNSSKDSQVVILTGATGFLGGHILAALVVLQSVSKVYVFMRPGESDGQNPAIRLNNSLRKHGFSISLDKVVPLYTDISQDGFGLADISLPSAMKSEATHIIHCAWAVNFAVQLPAFEPQLASLHNLLKFAMKTDKNVRFIFCSSIGVAQSTRGPATIDSAPIPSFDSCSPMGYSQSKLIGEHIVESATKKGANASVLRIGQIIPGRRRGNKLWKPTEALPLMVQSASKRSVGALPILDTGRDACDWIEADTLADTILQLAGIGYAVESTQLVYNLVNPRTFSWKEEFLPALRRAGLSFSILPWQEWLQRLELSTEDVSVNPSRKLLDFWRKQAKREGELTFSTSAAESATLALREAFRLVDGDFVEQIVEAWKQHEEITAEAQ